MKKRKTRRNKKFISAQHSFKLKEEGQDYARVVKLLGNSRVICKCYEDGVERLGMIRGVLQRVKKKENIISEDSIVLVSGRDYQEDKVDIISVYSNKEVEELQDMGEIPKESLQKLTEMLTFRESEDEEEMNIIDI